MPERRAARPQPSPSRARAASPSRPRLSLSAPPAWPSTPSPLRPPLNAVRTPEVVALFVGVAVGGFLGYLDDRLAAPRALAVRLPVRPRRHRRSRSASASTGCPIRSATTALPVSSLGAPIRRFRGGGADHPVDRGHAQQRQLHRRPRRPARRHRAHRRHDPRDHLARQRPDPADRRRDVRRCWPAR